MQVQQFFCVLPLLRKKTVKASDMTGAQPIRVQCTVEAQ